MNSFLSIINFIVVFPIVGTIFSFMPFKYIFSFSSITVLPINLLILTIFKSLPVSNNNLIVFALKSGDSTVTWLL